MTERTTFSGIMNRRSHLKHDLLQTRINVEMLNDGEEKANGPRILSECLQRLLLNGLTVVFVMKCNACDKTISGLAMKTVKERREEKKKKERREREETEKEKKRVGERRRGAGLAWRKGFSPEIGVERR
ncbi:hypothetical protein TNCV_1642961 [Trichonephila clavipes]|nr:hypothetical protein TNCV_1642961 [Trichonephila clavipes]